MITRSRSKILNKNNQTTQPINNQLKMASGRSENNSNEVEFEVNNLMGETGIFEELTNNGNPPVSSEARGPDEEDASTDVPSPQTPVSYTHLDVYKRQVIYHSE